MRIQLSWMLLLALSACGTDTNNNLPVSSPTEPPPSQSRYDGSGLNEHVIASYQALETLMADAAMDNTVTYYALPLSNDYDNIPSDPQNPITKEKVALGKLIFHETGITAGITDMKSVSQSLTVSFWSVLGVNPAAASTMNGTEWLGTYPWRRSCGRRCQR